jgi:hypothetical protein
MNPFQRIHWWIEVAVWQLLYLHTARVWPFIAIWHTNCTLTNTQLPLLFLHSPVCPLTAAFTQSHTSLYLFSLISLSLSLPNNTTTYSHAHPKYLYNNQHLQAATYSYKKDENLSLSWRWDWLDRYSFYWPAWLKWGAQLEVWTDKVLEYSKMKVQNFSLSLIYTLKWPDHQFSLTSS